MTPLAVCPFSVADLFVVGLASEIAGGLILGRGLLATPFEIARRAGTFVGMNPDAAIGAARDRVDAIFGLGALLAGFAVQIVGYVLVLGEGLEDGVGWGRAAVALGLAAITIAAIIIAWRLLRNRLLRRTLVAAAHYDINKGNMADKPFSPTLGTYARLLGHEPREDETGPGYARRVFGVTDVYPTGQRDDDPTAD